MVYEGVKRKVYNICMFSITLQLPSSIAAIANTMRMVGGGGEGEGTAYKSCFFSKHDASLRGAKPMH